MTIKCVVFILLILFMVDRFVIAFYYIFVKFRVLIRLLFFDKLVLIICFIREATQNCFPFVLSTVPYRYEDASRRRKK